MSTRANIILKQGKELLYFYRHSDGYPECTGEDLKEFVELYKSRKIREDISQSAGWLIIRGHWEYKVENKALGPIPNDNDRFNSWKVGAYEPTTALHGDIEYVYIIDLEAKTLTCRTPKSGFWDAPTLKNTELLKGFKISFENKVA